ncbi:MAG: NAD(P)/FAD-dependent oxidoreductase [Oscillospiraceae bacterium]|nr:NAD(P)/FAD-dependent oxidoreductase [Oscillospiraceae bacterium]
MPDVIIIGCGIVGAAAAYELSKYDLDVVVLEKENDVALGTTKANSAIIHAGYDPAPGTLMARLNVEGAKLAKELCDKLDVPYRQPGALVLAFTKQESLVIEQLKQNGVANGVRGLRILGKEEVLQLEPNLSEDVVSALRVPSTMIVSPWEYALALAETAVQNGVELKLECEVTRIEKNSVGYRVYTSQGEVEARYILNAAGLSADKIHNMVSEEAFEILPDRGEYYLLDKSEGTRVGHVVFQCPTDMGKGVLVAPTVHGNLIVGPSSAPTSDREDVSNTTGGLEYVMQTARKSVPGIDFRASIRNFAGNRAKTGQNDFIIAQSKGAKGFIDLAGIMSPGLSAAPAIAKMATELLVESGLDLSEKASYHEGRSRIRFNELSPSKKAELVARDPAYGRVICRCETVTEGEIRDALNAPIPPRGVDGVKRRCGAGMGRCQSGFCGPRVLEILSKHYGCQPTEVLQDEAGRYILTAETKRGQ